MSRFRALLFAVVVLPACGIVKVTYPSDKKAAAERNKKAPETQDQMEDRLDRQYFGEACKLLDQADAALDSGDNDKAFELATQARKKIEEEYAAEPTKFVTVSDALRRVSSLAIAVQGGAARAAGKDLDALVALGSSQLDAHSCPLAQRKRCQDYGEWLHQTFPHVIRYGDLAQIATTSGPFPRDLTTTLMVVNERMLVEKKGYYAIAIQETSHKPKGKDRASVRIDGKTIHDSYDACNKVGTARIGGADFDVQRCHKQGYVAPRANLVVDVPAADAEPLTDEPGERAIIVFDRKNWHRAGNTWVIKAARIAYVQPPPRH